jgi:hypothetical protein
MPSAIASGAPIASSTASPRNKTTLPSIMRGSW